MNRRLEPDDDLLRDALGVPSAIGAPSTVVDGIVRAMLVEVSQGRRPRRGHVGAWRRGPASLLLVAGLLTLIGMSLAWAIGGRPSITGCPVPQGGTLPPAVTTIAAIPRDADRDILGADGDTVWLIDTASVSPVDPHGGADGLGAIGEPIPIPLPGDPVALPDVPASSGWWLTERAPSSTIAFFPRSATFGPWIDVGMRPYRIAASDEALFVTDFEAGRVARIDLATRAVAAKRELRQAAGIAIAPDGNVIVASRDGRLLWLDPATLETLGESAVGRSVMHLVPDGDRMIIQRNAGGPSTWFDPLDIGAAEQGAGAAVTSLALAPDAAWAAQYAPPAIVSPPLLRLDRTTLRPVAVTEPEPGTFTESLAVADGDVWTVGSDPADGLPELYRLEPLPCG